MTNLIPKWIMLAYSNLFKTFQEKPFTTEEAKKILNDKTAIVLHKLNRAGWVEFVGFDKKDQRKRYYKLKNPQEAITNLAQENIHGSRRNTRHKKNK